MEIVAVAAVAENGVIGADGELPWDSVPADKRQYRERVAHFPVVLGRRTYESMRADLPGMIQIVLTTNPGFNERSSTTIPAHSVPNAIARAREVDTDRLYVLGGGSVYEAFWHHFDRLVVSRIPGDYQGDTRFPEIDPAEWELLDSEPMPGFTLEYWRRRAQGNE